MIAKLRVFYSFVIDVDVLLGMSMYCRISVKCCHTDLPLVNFIEIFDRIFVI